MVMNSSLLALPEAHRIVHLAPSSSSASECESGAPSSAQVFPSLEAWHTAVGDKGLPPKASKIQRKWVGSDVLIKLLPSLNSKQNFCGLFGWVLLTLTTRTESFLNKKFSTPSLAELGFSDSNFCLKALIPTFCQVWNPGASGARPDRHLSPCLATFRLESGNPKNS